MVETYALALERVGQKATNSKHHYDIKVRCSILSPGDRVLVRKLGEREGPGKLIEQGNIFTKHLNDDSPVSEVVLKSGPKTC